MTARYLVTDRGHGDLADPACLAAALAPGRTTWLHQVHGAGVVTVTRPGEHAGADADAAVTAVPGCVLAVRTADCAPIVLVGESAVGAVHAGWRGLVAGVVERAVEALAALGATRLGAVLGPCIGAECYEFGAGDLDAVAARLGDGVRARTATGSPALDLQAGVRAALARVGVDDVVAEGGCTACGAERWFSYRARREAARFVTAVWLEPVEQPGALLHLGRDLLPPGGQSAPRTDRRAEVGWA